MTMKNIVIIYHGDCADGFGGAYAAWKKFGNRADYVGMKNHSDPLPPGLKNRKIYIIDFGFNGPVMRKLIRDNKVVALDHHVTAEETTKMADEYVYTLKNSGAVIAWRYFHPVRSKPSKDSCRHCFRAVRTSNGVHPQKPAPRLLRHIEDVDLWRFKMPHTREIFSYLQLFDYNFREWDKLIKNMENPRRYREYLQRGKDILRYESLSVSRLIKNAEAVRFGGYKTMAVNSPVLKSEIGHALVKKLPPIGIVWSVKRGIIAVSLRSDGKADVAKLAEKFGGGGHKAAAGFSLPANKPFPWKVLKPKF